MQTDPGCAIAKTISTVQKLFVKLFTELCFNSLIQSLGEFGVNFFLGFRSFYARVRVCVWLCESVLSDIFHSFSSYSW